MFHPATSPAINAPVLSQAELSLHAADLYAACAASYDQQLCEDCSYRTPNHVVELLREHNALEHSAHSAHSARPTWLDLGAGTGLVGQALAASGADFCLLAVDISREMLARADAELYVACYCLDVFTESLPLTAEASGALAVGLSEHGLDIPRFFAGVYAALKPGGRFIFTHVPSAVESAQVFEESTQALAHGSSFIDISLAQAGFAIEAHVVKPAYVNRNEWIAHRILLARKA